jgi:spore coat protein U-like protein
MKYLVVIITALVMVLTASSAMAQPATNNLGIAASVLASCSITSVTDLDFGTYDTTSGTDDDDGAGDVVFKCTKDTDYDVYITGTRSMTVVDTLTFELYTDAGRTSVFPSATVGEAGTAPSNGNITMNIYGRIPNSQDVAVASYSTTLTVNVNW